MHVHVLRRTHGSQRTALETVLSFLRTERGIVTFLTMNCRLVGLPASCRLSCFCLLSHYRNEGLQTQPITSMLFVGTKDSSHVVRHVQPASLSTEPSLQPCKCFWGPIEWCLWHSHKTVSLSSLTLAHFSDLHLYIYQDPSEIVSCMF